MLPTPLVDSIFARFTVRYGAAWTRMWDGVKTVALKDDWATELACFSNKPDALFFALDNLPERPPNVAQFRAICLRAPEVFVPALPAPRNPKLAAEFAEKAWHALADCQKHAASKAWANRLRDRELSGERMSVMQRQMWRTALATQQEPNAERAS